MKQTYSGGCQCGAVRYEASAGIGEVIACNCSRCAKPGSLLTFVPAQDFKLMKGEGATADFQFNKYIIHHRFCSTCGIQSYANGKAPNGAEMVAINVRCLDGVDPDSFKVKKFDGRTIERNADASWMHCARNRDGRACARPSRSQRAIAAGTKDQIGHRVRRW